MQTEFTGSCHCGAIGFTYRTAVAPGDWAVRACQCSFCRAHDALSTSDPGGELAFDAPRPEFLQKYRFGLMTADFLLCKNCGVYIGALIETDGKRFGIINLHALRETPADMPATAPISYDGEDTGDRVARRELRWTPVTGHPA